MDTFGKLLKTYRRNSTDPDRGGGLTQERLGEFLQRGESATLEEIELSQPFTERIVYPLARKFGERAQSPPE